MMPHPFLFMVSSLCLVTPLSAAAAANADDWRPPAVRRFHNDPIVLTAGTGPGERSTVMYRSIDVSGIDSNTLIGSLPPATPSNVVLDLLFPPGATIRGFGYDATYTYFGSPANPAMGFRFFNATNDEIIAPIVPGGSPSPLSEPDTDVGAPNWITVPDGHLRVEFFEAVDDRTQPQFPERDGTWNSGEVRVLYELGGDVECCIWDNGPFDNRDGALSQDALNRLPNPFYHVMADDFYLEPNYVHMIEYMEAVFITQFPAPAYAYDTPIGRLEIRSDCDGKPGALLETFDIVLPRDAFQGEISTPDGPADIYRVVAPTPNLCLTGGKPYWVSFVMFGITAQGGVDEWYWGTTGSLSLSPPYDPPLHVKGSLPHRQIDPNAPWERIDCVGNDPNCLGCTDLNFCIRGERCKIVYDAGTYKTPPQPAGQVITQFGARSIDVSGVSTRQARAADDVTISPCETDLCPCVIEAYIWTTCTPAAAKLEIYETECEPNSDFVRPADAPLVFTITADESDAVFQNLTIPAGAGPEFRLFCFKFKEFGGFQFTAGKTYWISAVGTGGNNATNDAYFAFSAPKCPEDECYRFGNEGFAKSAYTGSGYPDWTPTSMVPNLLEANDFAMLVAVRQCSGTPAGGGAPACRADFDRSGQVAVADIFSFLSEWFSGCP